MCRIFKMRCFSVPFIFGLSEVSRIVLAVASSSILCIADCSNGRVIIQLSQAELWGPLGLSFQSLHS